MFSKSISLLESAQVMSYESGFLNVYTTEIQFCKNMLKLIYVCFTHMHRSTVKCPK